MATALLRDVALQFARLPYPGADLSDMVVVVTGSNTGLGLEAARHFVRLKAAKVILAVRNLEKGRAAKNDIENTTSRPGAVEVWQLDLKSFTSVQSFARRVNSLDRLDILVENAGVNSLSFEKAEDNESTIAVNVLGTFLLALNLLPKLRETAHRFNVLPHIVVLTSGLHFLADFTEAQEEDIYAALNSSKRCDMQNRYAVSKLMDIFLARELAERAKGSTLPSVIVNAVDPGLCRTELTREFTGLTAVAASIANAILARTAETGSRNIIYAAVSREDTHGKYLSSCCVRE